MAISNEREEAIATFPADLQTVGGHGAISVVAGGSTWLAKPDNATHVKVQALLQNLRYRIDDAEAAATVGFQLQAGADTLIPVPGRGVSWSCEAGAGTLQYQWVR